MTIPTYFQPHLRYQASVADDAPIFAIGKPSVVAKEAGFNMLDPKLARFIEDAEAKGYAAVRVRLQMIAVPNNDIYDVLTPFVKDKLLDSLPSPVPLVEVHPLLQQPSEEVKELLAALRDEDAKKNAFTFWQNASSDDQKIACELMVEMERAKADDDAEALESAQSALDEIVADKPLGQLKGLIRKNEWTEADQRASHAEGWDIFQRSDTGKLEINRLDEVDNVWEEEGNEGDYPGPRHENDHHAAVYVQKKADEGDVRCRKAIEILIDGGSPDVKKFNLNDAAWTKRDEKGWIEIPHPLPPVESQPLISTEEFQEAIAEAKSSTATPEEFNAYVDDEIATHGGFTMDLPNGKKLRIEKEPPGGTAKYSGYIGHNEAGVEALADTPHEVYSEVMADQSEEN